ncbi:MAG: tetratricopeptide repeat protein [Treponema sp.]|nr:tetratricopeptide repeat protein [Treponema sp.]
MLPILAAVFVLILIVFVFYFFMSRFKGGFYGGFGKRSGNREAIFKTASKRLVQNPNDPEALYSIAGYYFEEGSWDKAMKTYDTLSGILTTRPEPGIDSFEVYLRHGLAAQKLDLIDQAYKSFHIARGYRQDNFEVNFNIGAIEFERKNYEKAVQLLQQARIQDPDNPAALRILGHALFRMKKPKDAMNFIRKAIDLAPDDKESLYTLAECYHEAGQTEQALRIFNHLRPDPVMGPNACLISGIIHLETRLYDAAAADFEIGLRHQNVKVDILTELRYRLALTYIKLNEIGKAIPLLRLIQTENSSYKDVNVLLSKYQELNANRNLHTFLMASSADFIALCRRIVLSYFPKAKVKITNISVNKNEWADILAEVDTPRWSDLIMFRFIRTQGSVGELVIRDFHSHLKEVKAGKGICVSVGSFTEEARRYTEARLIDLIEKERLQAILNALDSRSAAVSKK